MTSDLNGEPIIGSFHGKQLQKTSQEKFRTGKAIKKWEMVRNCTLNGEDTIVRLIVGLIKKTLNEITSYKNEWIIS